ncbi:serine/threonine-protein kinase [Fodinicola acaciae]|uniref:serine/threonine-protein kinase n=1 Tax=Fodinicola acaciae TaxID=2681555 RepID=UPI0013D7DE57|nr:serine/threonine-protein kinase [Fodinicola acaciae]
MDGIADYEFVRSLGTGNHGEFFLAKTPQRLPVDAPYVAVKVLSGEKSEDVFRRATRELKAFAAVQSPHLVALYDAGQQAGVVYYSMEYLSDGSLAEPANTLELGRVADAVASAARAAHALHEAGIVHNDIKPANILLGGDGSAKLSDLGLSRVLAPGMTMTGMGSLGSVEFTDPALLHGDSPSRASDIFSLGATLHRVATGRGLFGDLPDSDPVLVLRRVLSTKPDVAPDLDPEIAAVVRSCIAEDRTERPATAAEVADRLTSIAA